MITLFENRYGVFTQELDGRIVRVRRTSEPVRDAAPYTLLTSEFSRLVPLSTRGRLGLLIDAREAPFLSQDTLEQGAALAVATMSTGFARVGVLMKTAVGMLQARRIGREHPMGAADPTVFVDEQAALAFVSAFEVSSLSSPQAPRRGPTSR